MNYSRGAAYPTMLRRLGCNRLCILSKDCWNWWEESPFWLLVLWEEIFCWADVCVGGEGGWTHRGCNYIA
jgi:hypothetical protein